MKRHIKIKKTNNRFFIKKRRKIKKANNGKNKLYTFCRSKHEIPASFLVETWKLNSLFDSLLGEISEEKRNRYKNKWLWFRKQFEEFCNANGFDLIDKTNEVYDHRLPVVAINIADFQNDDNLVIEQMIEPIIMSNGKIENSGKAVLRRSIYE
ncbi:MAG: hypothetical protein LBC92_01760 [Rickettsiales bacterium]|jgi:hypothetical protein|nr:hypothetical protein [Rickettsiales bacterium]